MVFSVKSALALTGLLATASLALAANATSPAAPPQAPPGCHSEEGKQFDFWVGRWNVYPRQKLDQHIADSLIEKKYTGCAIRENWMPLLPKGEGGGSLSTYVPDKKIWRQFWVDSAGSAANFTGGWNGKSMVITGVWATPANPSQMTRMSYTPLGDGTVEQRGETSDDGGKTWRPGFDLIYKKAKN